MGFVRVEAGQELVLYNVVGQGARHVNGMPHGELIPIHDRQLKVIDVGTKVGVPKMGKGIALLVKTEKGVKVVDLDERRGHTTPSSDAAVGSDRVGDAFPVVKVTGCKVHGDRQPCQRHGEPQAFSTIEKETQVD